MGRPLDTKIYRPETCPKGHAGAIHIHTYSRWTPEHQKIQYRRVAKGEKRHKFTMAMPPRQPTHIHPLGGQACTTCERPYLVGQGPTCGHHPMRASMRDAQTRGRRRSDHCECGAFYADFPEVESQVAR